ncbi:F-box protein At2g05970-like [Carex rostrata]
MSWSDLPSELVITIARNLTEFADRLRFRSVCSHWRSSFHSHTLCLPPQLPWLVFPAFTSSTHFYSFSEDRVYSNPPPNVSDNSNLFGSASGWFLSITISGKNRLNTISLINPFTCVVIGLPFLYPCLLNGIVYTLVWDRSDSVVVAGFRRRRGVFYCRLGDAAWGSLKFLHCTPRSITFCEDKFYILDFDTFDTIVLDGKTLEQITVIRPPFMWPLYFCPAHLFVSSGELFLLGRSTGDSTYGGLPVYDVRRANVNDGVVEWIAINNIGDRALFVDDLHCFSVKVEDNCLLKKNCIYSTKYTKNGGLGNSSWAHSIFIFDLGNNSGKRLGDAMSKFHVAFSRAAVPSPSWVLPSLS